MVKEKILNIPNTITFVRITVTFFIVYLILKEVNPIIIAVFFVIFALSDMVDGTLARKLKQTTTIGARLDQVADRIYFGGVLIALYFTSKEYVSTILIPSYIPKSLILSVISREIVAFPAFLYLLVSNKEFIKVRCIGKIATVLQAVSIPWLIVRGPFLIYPLSLTAFFGVIAGLTYWYDVARTRPIKYVKKKIKERKLREKGKI